MNTTHPLDLNYCPPPPPPLPVFEEELIVFNACPTIKITKFQKGFRDEKGKTHPYVNRYISHKPGLMKNGSSKHYKVHFKGNFYRFSKLMELISNYGLTWMRNQRWYRNEETGENHPSNFLLIDFDDLGPITGAELMQYEYDNVKTCFAMESSSNETVFSFKEEFIEEIGDNIGRFVAENINGKTKFHVFLKTDPFDYNNETLRDKVFEETSCIFSYYGMDSNTGKVARKKHKNGQPLSTVEHFAFETSWDPQAAYVSQKTFSVLNPRLLDEYPERFYLSYKAEREIGLVYTLNDFPSIFEGLSECVTVEPLLKFPKSITQRERKSRSKEQQDITENLLETENFEHNPSSPHSHEGEPRSKEQQDIKGNPLGTGHKEVPLPTLTTEEEHSRSKEQQDITDFKTWFGKRKLKSEAPFILLSASMLQAVLASMAFIRQL